MRIISSGSRYMVFPDDINTHDQLPAGTYRVNFSQNSGFSLERVADLKVGDEKLYDDVAVARHLFSNLLLNLKGHLVFLLKELVQSELRNLFPHDCSAATKPL